MRTLSVIATIVAAVLFMSSCDWFKSSPGKKQFDLVGKWKIDSIINTNDSTSNASKFMASLVLSKDTGSGIDFKADSTYVQIVKSNKSNGKYYLKDTLLVISKDTSYTSYRFRPSNDSVVNLYATDSVGVVLKRL